MFVTGNNHENLEMFFVSFLSETRISHNSKNYRMPGEYCYEEVFLSSGPQNWVIGM
jgi:hypothetical protein